MTSVSGRPTEGGICKILILTSSEAITSHVDTAAEMAGIIVQTPEIPALCLREKRTEPLVALFLQLVEGNHRSIMSHTRGIEYPLLAGEFLKGLTEADAAATPVEGRSLRCRGGLPALRGGDESVLPDSDGQGAAAAPPFPLPLWPGRWRQADYLKTCKVHPQGRGGLGGGRGRGPAAPATYEPKDYMVTEVPGVIAAGTKWTEVWHDDGNNADGIIATKDGGAMFAQNDESRIVKIDKNGQVTKRPRQVDR